MTYKQSVNSIIPFGILRILALIVVLLIIIPVTLFLVSPWFPFTLGCYSTLCTGHYKDAAKYYKMATDRDPRFVLAVSDSAAMHNYFGEIEEAINDCNRALAIDHERGLVESVTLFNRAYAYNRLGRYKEALADCNSVLAGMFMDNSIQATVLVNRGEAYDALNQHEKSRTDYDKALKLIPNPPSAAFMLIRARALIGLGQFDQALNQLDKAVKNKPELPLLYIYRAAVDEKLGRHDTSQHDIERAKQLCYRLTPAN
jgi:tetratricopeptide (TPR) repeat protein